MKRLDKSDPAVQQIVQQMYEQRQQVGKISSMVGYLNMEHLKTELYKLGWLAHLEKDGETIRLDPVGHEEEAKGSEQ